MTAPTDTITIDQLSDLCATAFTLGAQHAHEMAEQLVDGKEPTDHREFVRQVADGESLPIATQAEMREEMLAAGVSDEEIAEWEVARFSMQRSMREVAPLILRGMRDEPE